MNKPRTLTRIYLAGTLLLASAAAQTPITTQITDALTRADGTPATGTVLISWPAFTLATGANIPAGSTSITLGAGGALNVNLAANAGATPIGTYYTAIYHLDDGTVTREYWVIPVATAPVHLAAIRSTVLPASVAMQTVSKSYVDTAIAAAALQAGPGQKVVMPQPARLLAAYLMNEGTGTMLADSSGQGNSATVNGPAWEGTQDLNFTIPFTAQFSNGPTIALPAALNAAQTFLYLAYFPIEGSQAAPLAPGYGLRQGFSAIMGGTTQQHLNLLASLSERTYSYKFHAFNTDNTQAGEFMPPGWHVFVLTCGSPGVPAHEYYDGAEVGSYVTQGQNTCPMPSSGNYVLGGSPAYSGQQFTGKFAGMWAWSKALSPSDATLASANALALLDQKGISRSFRAANSTVPQILAIGDSRSSGYTLPAGADWLDKMALTDSTYARTNLAVPSQQTPDMCNNFDLAYASHAGRASAPVITIVWAGMSDLQVGGTTGPILANYLKCIVTKAKQLGRVVLATEISGAGQNTDSTRDALNTLLRAQAYGWGVDNLADLATEPHVGPDGASANTGCYPDQLHPGPACESYITSVLQNAVNELLGSSETQHHQTAAASYQELAGDRFLDLTGTSAQSITLPDCTGYSLPRQALNLGSATATFSTANGQALLGATTLAPNARAVFLPVPNPPGTAGCKWERTQ